MKKLIAIAAIAMSACIFTGCSTTTQGRITANIVYSVYQKVAANEGSTIAARVQAVWIKLDAVESFDQLPEVYTDTVAELNQLIDTVKNPLVKHVLRRVKAEADAAVTTAITKTTSTEEAQAYLIAFRDELRTKFGAIERCNDPLECGF